jgi:hypothetical protein
MFGWYFERTCGYVSFQSVSSPGRVTHRYFSSIALAPVAGLVAGAGAAVVGAGFAAAAGAVVGAAAGLVDAALLAGAAVGGAAWVQASRALAAIVRPPPTNALREKRDLVNVSLLLMA